MVKNEEKLINLWVTIKYTNIFLMGVPESKEIDKRVERIFKELMAKNFSKGEKH